MFTMKTDVKSYLKMFDLFLKEERIYDDSYKCVVLLSKLQAECIQMIESYSPNVSKSYNRLTSTMLKLFGKRDLSPLDASLMFIHREMTDKENIYQYYAALNELGLY